MTARPHEFVPGSARSREELARHPGDPGRTRAVTLTGAVDLPSPHYAPVRERSIRRRQGWFAVVLGPPGPARPSPEWRWLLQSR